MSCEMISSRKIDYYVNDPYAMIIDLRSEQEYNRSHIKNAINIDFDDLDYKVYLLDKSKIIVLYCERGSTSLIAAKRLGAMRYEVKSVIGGINMYNGRNLVYRKQK